MPQIRRATTEDLPVIVDLWSREGAPTRHPPTASVAAQLLARDPDALLVAIEDGRIAGTLIVGWDGWRCHLYRLAVEPDLRRRGIARALVEAAHARAVALGAVRLDALVSQENEAALAFWPEAGFEPDPGNALFSLVLVVS